MEQKIREFESRKRYVAAIIIGTVAFLLIFVISYSLSYLELDRVSNFQAETGYDIFKDKLDYSFFNESVCEERGFDKVSRDIGFQGRIIDDLEQKLGKQDEVVLSRKQFYTLVELEHLEFVNILNRECNKQINTILFFYSNNKSKIDESEEAGRILGVVSSRNENLMIYSFDVDLSSDIIQKLKQKYGITESPIIVINEKKKMTVPDNIDEIEVYLK